MITTKTNILILILLLIAQLTLVSCSNAVIEDAQPNIGVDDQYLNKQVIVRAPQSFNSFQTNEAVVLEILSISSNEIRFSKDYSLRIFKKTNNGWVEIKELPIIRLPEDDIIFSPNSSAIEDLAVFPDLKDHSQNYHLRIYVIGDMKTEQGIEKVSAFTDIQLQP